MNERIRELAKEHFCRTEYDNGAVHTCYEFSESDLQEFIELIIDDITDIIDVHVPGMVGVDVMKRIYGYFGDGE
jgi:broad-specificity NMP kinase